MPGVAHPVVVRNSEYRSTTRTRACNSWARRSSIAWSASCAGQLRQKKASQMVSAAGSILPRRISAVASIRSVGGPRCQVSQILDHRQRDMFGGRNNARFRPRPAPTEVQTALTVERSCTERLAQQSVVRLQLTPAVTDPAQHVSTWRAPDSASIMLKPPHPSRGSAAGANPGQAGDRRGDVAGNRDETWEPVEAMRLVAHQSALAPPALQASPAKNRASMQSPGEEARGPK